MKYYARVNKRIRDVHVYNTVKRIGGSENFLTKLFVRIFNPKEAKSARTAEKLS
jgi:hypothetical protein